MNNQIYILGDIHQSFKPIRELYKTLNASTDVNKHPDKTDTLILLGDAGANFFFDFHDRNFKEKLGRYNFTYFIIRGNHEERAENCMERNPNDWHIEEYFGNQVRVENAYPYIKYALDQPALYNINGYSTMVFPGAYSVDKYFRIAHNLGWFKDEQLTEEEMALGKKMVNELGSCDLVLSHTCPKIYQPTDLFLNVIDQSLVDNTMERYLGNIEYQLEYTLWLFGHYHKLRIYPEYEGRQVAMLSNDCVLHLNAFQKDKNIYNALIKIVGQGEE